MELLLFCKVHHSSILMFFVYFLVVFLFPVCRERLHVRTLTT